MMELYIAVVAAAAFFHLIMGSDVYMIAGATAISIHGAFSLRKQTVLYSDFFLFMLSLYMGFFALIFKCFLGQDLQSNLVLPIDSMNYALVGYFSIAAASLVAKKVFYPGISHVILDKFKSAGNFNSVLLMTILGTVLQILHILLKPKMEGVDVESVEGFGGFGSFYFILLAAVVLQFDLMRRNLINKKIVYVTFAIFFLMALVGNAKKNLVDYILIAVLSVFYLNLKIVLKPIAVVSYSVMFFVVVGYISPAIHIVRSGISEIGLFDRIVAIYDVVHDNGFNPVRLREIEDDALSGFDYAYSPQGSYIYPSSLGVDRFMLILPIDQVVRYVHERSNYEMGFDKVMDGAVDRILPGFLVEKKNYIGGDLIAWNYKIRDQNSIGRPVIGFVASSIAAWGYYGCIIFPFIILLPFFIFMNNISGDLRNNIWAILVIVSIGTSVEMTMDGFVGVVFRQVPIIVIGIFVAAFILPGNKSINKFRNQT
jgi:hypothetical protein